MDKAKEKLGKLKSNVRNAHDYFNINYRNYNKFMSFIYDTSLTHDDQTLLSALGMPQLEFNICEAYISRLLGEFAKQEPSIEVSSDNESNADPQTVKLVEAHLRHLLLDSENHHTRYEIFKAILSGGYSVAKMSTEYAHSMSFHQVLKYAKAYDDTLCGFDPMAIESHKGDGRYCFELFPMTEGQFKEEYPDIDISDLSFRGDESGFNWVYTKDSEKYLLVCDYYEKKTKKIKIVQLADGKVVEMKEYEKMLKEWNEMQPPPAIIGRPRATQKESIIRHRFVENQFLIEGEETDYTLFPLIFFDGNSAIIKTNDNGNVHQLCRSYLWHVLGAQKLKNYAGITMANDLENQVQHKFMVAKEALPKEEIFLDAYKDVQRASTLVFNAFVENNPSQPIPNPLMPMPRVPAPPEIIQAFVGADSLIQNILGSYDAANGVNGNDVSGKAIIEGASNSNAAAMPYIVGYLQGLQRIAQFDVDMIPKLYTTPRTVPILMPDGKKDYVKINQEDGPNMFYDENALNVKVEAGVNFQVQKSRALQQIISLANAVPSFGEFVNDVGLVVVLDNIEVRGVDQLREMAEKWMQMKEQERKVEMQKQEAEAQNNPMVIHNQIEMQKLQAKLQEDSMQHMVDMEKLQLERIKLGVDLQDTAEMAAIRREEVEARKEKTQVDALIAQEELRHKRFHDIATLHHTIHQPPKEPAKKT